MKYAILASLVLISGIAQADQTKMIECGFTEPFFSLQIDLVKKEITKTSPNWEQGGEGVISEVIATNISVKVDMSDEFLPTYEILNAQGAILVEMAMTMKGSDGMSDIVYPFSGKFEGNHGGCSSDRISPIEPQ